MFSDNVFGASDIFCAGFRPSASLRPDTKNLFNKQLRDALRNSQSADYAGDYRSAAEIFGKQNSTWAEIATAFESLEKFIREGSKSGYARFEDDYLNRPDGSGERWADEDLKKIIGLFQYANGVRKIGIALDQHTDSTSSDYADDIYADLQSGKLVIVDQSSGDPLLNQSSAKRIMQKIFFGNLSDFTSGKQPKEILVYIEEAHNLLPAGNNPDMSDVWVRTAIHFTKADNVFKRMFERLRLAGKSYKSAVIAAAHKMLKIAHALLKSGVKWENKMTV